MKKCSRCQSEDVEKEGSRNWKGVWCRSCFQSWSREYYRRNKQKVRENQKNYQRKRILPEGTLCYKCNKNIAIDAGKVMKNGQSGLCGDCIRQRDRDRYARNKEKIRLQAKARYDLRPVIERQSCSIASYRRNHEKAVYYRIKGNAKRRGATEFMSFEEWNEVISGTVCHWCGIEITPSIRHYDHVTPLSEGGQHVKLNVVISCANCNQKRAWEQKTKYPELYK